MNCQAFDPLMAFGMPQVPVSSSRAGSMEYIGECANPYERLPCPDFVREECVRVRREINGDINSLFSVFTPLLLDSSTGRG
jgi:hypothetical protein